MNKTLIIKKHNKKLKNSQAVAELFEGNSGVVDYKGGYAVVIKGRVKEIFVNKGAYDNAVARLKNIKK